MVHIKREGQKGPGFCIVTEHTNNETKMVPILTLQKEGKRISGFDAGLCMVNQKKQKGKNQTKQKVVPILTIK